MLLKRLGAFFLDILEVVVFAIAFFLFLYLLVFQPHKIKGASMDPNFKDAEYLLTDKVTYRFNEPKRGDVIVFKAPGLEGEEFIKRIIGLPGETISVSQNTIYVNGEVLSEKYIGFDKYTSSGAFLEEGKTIKIPEDNYIVMGDNRPHSSDSRSWGFVPKNDISGRAWFVYWPISILGTVEKVNYNL
ncbi:signal peptidase I [Patescibacteria group bacterium]|nr:signal peptidase I [Patescibacteria group bacterium]